jgi:hypothetical protein
VQDASRNWFDIIEKEDLKKLLGNSMIRLTDKEREILELYFGLFWNDEHSQEEVWRLTVPPISWERVRQIKQKALERLQRILYNSTEWDTQTTHWLKSNTERFFEYFHKKELNQDFILFIEQLHITPSHILWESCKKIGIHITFPENRWLWLVTESQQKVLHNIQDIRISLSECPLTEFEREAFLRIFFDRWSSIQTFHKKLKKLWYPGKQSDLMSELQITAKNIYDTVKK